MILYGIMHGSYGLIWFMKDLYFPDKFGQTRSTITCFIACWLLILGPYMLPAWLIASRNTEEITDKKWLYSWLLVYIIGVMIAMTSDCQKNTAIKFYNQYNVTKGKPFLITDGLFKYTRNPNFLGEMMLYLSFAAICNHYIAYAIVIYSWVTIMAARIFQKEMSLMTKPGWNQYSQ